MPQGTQISGEDGIVILKTMDGTVIGEVPCLTNWNIDSSAALNESSTKCMKSNGDGGSDSAGSWTKSRLESKSWTGSLEFFWQENQLIPASVQLDVTNVGDRLKLEVYPNDNVTGKVVYSGEAIIESAGTPSEVNGDIKQSVSFKGSGPLVKAVVV